MKWNPDRGFLKWNPDRGFLKWNPDRGEEFKPQLLVACTRRRTQSPITGFRGTDLINFKFSPLNIILASLSFLFHATEYYRKV